MRTNRLLGSGLVSLGGLVIVYAVLGPLVLVVIHFRTAVSGLNQIRGGDLAALSWSSRSDGRLARLARPPGGASAGPGPGNLRDVHLLPAHSWQRVPAPPRQHRAVLFVAAGDVPARSDGRDASLGSGPAREKIRSLLNEEDFRERLATDMGGLLQTNLEVVDAYRAGYG